MSREIKELSGVNNRPDILFAHRDLATIDRGGICVLFKSLSAGLASKGYKVHLLSTRDISLEGVSVHRLPDIEDPRKYSQVVTEAVEDIDPLIAECSTWRYELLDYSNRHGRRSRLVVRADPSAETLFQNAEHHSEGERVLCANADLILAVSDFAKRDIQTRYGVSDDKIHVVYNGIPVVETPTQNSTITSGEILHPELNDAQRIQSLRLQDVLKPQRINIIWIGKPTSMKGFDFLEALVANATDEFNFVVNLGYSPNEIMWKDENYRKCTFIRGLSKSDQAKLISGSDVLLSTSRFEGFGIVVAEALQFGVPAVINLGCEVFNEFKDINGVSLVDVLNLEKVYSTLRASKLLKTRSSLLPDFFTQNQMVNKSLEYYQELLGSNKS
ncbi:MAG: glycosyltransferase [Candidatus Levybacteria bacterium]|nr:glycosyltransferase [Candidatus Levybacteria bacterium]